MGSHWYRADGTLVDGADLRQARKENLYPSVTTILDILDKPGLTRWKLRVGQDESDRVGAETSAEGMRIHDLVAQWIGVYMVTADYPSDDLEAAAEQAGIVDDDLLLLRPTLEWLRDNLSRKDPVMSELTLTHRMGYAGTLDIAAHDLNGARVIVDMKTRDVRGKKPDKYFEYGMQLGGYESLIDPTQADEHRWFTLVINRDAHRPMCIAQEWGNNEKSRARRAFSAIVMAWQAIKNFDPSIPEDA